MSKLILKAFKSEEYLNDKLHQKIPKFEISSFNLIIGDNAQGKSRFFNTLNFIRGLMSSTSGGVRVIVSKFSAGFEFELNGQIIEYNLQVLPSNQSNKYEEEIIKNGITILSTKDNIVVDEKENKKIENFFLPENVIAINALKDERFTTCRIIKSFFERVLILPSNKSKEIRIGGAEKILSQDGANVSNVMLYLMEHDKPTFNEIVSSFRECFPLVETFQKHQVPLSNGMQANLIAFNEKKIGVIAQTDWSDGMHRLLAILIMVNTKFTDGQNALGPSLICIDEIENGLDFKNLKNAISYLKEICNDQQLILTSHSPLVCNFIEPKCWRIAKRLGHVINFIHPSNVEKDLNAILNEYKMDYWDFYMKHISNSKLYSVKNEDIQ